MAFSNQVQHGFTGFEENLNLSYADILEMSINFLSDSMPDPMPSMDNKLSAFISSHQAT